VFSKQYVLARWVYSELLSPTLGDGYQEIGVPTSVRDQRHRGQPFDALNEQDRNLLAVKWAEARGVPMLNEPLSGITTFNLVHWRRNELGAVYVLPVFVSDVVSESLAFGVSLTFQQWIGAVPVKSLHHSHARYAGFGPVPSATQDDPLTVGYADGRLVLLDGYHRAVRFWMSNEPEAGLAVYVPA
jgi:hypothetical protein